MNLRTMIAESSMAFTPRSEGLQEVLADSTLEHVGDLRRA